MNKLKLMNWLIFRKIHQDLLHQSYPIFFLVPDKQKLKEKLLLKHLFLAALSKEFRLVLSHRIQNTLWTSGYKKLAYLLYLLAKWKYNCDIHPAAVIGPGLRVGHCSDIVIGPEVVIGSFAIIFNGVTLGNKMLIEKNNMPRLGDYVHLGTGCKILGDIFIGNMVTVGANSVVIRSVPKGKVVAGVPAQIINTIQF
jgi:serine O-acetyltransferase